MARFPLSLFADFLLLEVGSVGSCKGDELLSRWSLDEGTGSVLTAGSYGQWSFGVILHPGSGWGVSLVGTAKSGFSLDLSSGSGRGTVLHDPRLQASNDFTCMLGLKVRVSQ